MGGQEMVSYFLVLLVSSFIGLAVSISPVSPDIPDVSQPSMHVSPGLPPYLPVPGPSIPRSVKAGYWPSFDSLPVSAVDTSYFTHVYYAFLLPDPVTYKLAITPNDQQMLPLFVTTLKDQRSQVKTMLSIGGGGHDPKVFSKMAMTSAHRAIFILSAVEIARRYGFDGLDLDWEYPLDQNDMANLGVLYKEWREALEKEAKATSRPRLLLTTAVHYASTVLDGVIRSYPGKAMGEFVDWVSPMCYDYHGSWDDVTGQASALYDPDSNLNTYYGIKSWIDAGVPKKNLVMGLPMYGHTWTLKDPNVSGVGAPAVGVGPGEGVLKYSDVVDFNSKYNATVVYDGVSASMYSYAGDVWIGYDDPGSVKEKVHFASYHGLLGYFLWDLAQDLNWAISREASRAWGH